jgi:hypothetical protein
MAQSVLLTKRSAHQRSSGLAEVQNSPSVTELDSLIVSEFPPLFEEFHAKQWLLLWRSNCDGFGANEFHSRCDGHANTVTIIEDTNGNVLGGFTPLEWESRFPGTREKGDNSVRTFLFTLNNPSGVPPRKFALRREKKSEAIHCCPKSGPVFGGGCITITHKGNETTNNNTDGFGVNGGEEDKVLTGARNFRVKKAEVFELTD